MKTLPAVEAKAEEPEPLAERPASRTVWGHVETWAYAAVILLVGLAFRSTYIGLGFNATDEGFRQSLARRIVEGQVPYRDFDTNFAPVSIYKEAAIQLAFGPAYNFVVSRWAFVFEATLASVLAYFILCMFIGRRRAFWFALPTTFFSILIYVYENYTYDGEFFALLALLLLMHASGDRRWLAVAAGVAASLAVLSKPPFAVFVVFVLVAAVVGRRWLTSDEERFPMLYGMRHLWPRFLAGFAATFVAVLAAFAVAGAAQAYMFDVFVSYGRSNPTPIDFLIWQDLPVAFTRRELELFAAVFAVVLVGVIASRRWIRATAVSAVPIGLWLYLWRYHTPDDFVPMAMGVLLGINLMALAATLVVRTPWLRDRSWRANELKEGLPPPELFYFALGLQYMAQFTGTGILYSYLGTYLSLPVALMFMAALIGPALRPTRVLRFSSMWAAPAGVAAWLILASVLFIQGTAYFDYPRSQLNASFSTPELAGITSNQANVDRVEGVVSAVEKYTQPGDPIFVIPDFPALYLVTDRRNPTRIDWYQSIVLTPDLVARAVADLQADPPKLVVVQTRYEQDYSRSRPEEIIDYENTRATPIYNYLFAHYHDVEKVGDIRIMLLGSS